MPEGAAQVAVLSAGIWQLRDFVREITGCEPVRWAPPLRRPRFGSVIGWGLKPTARKAIELSRRTDTNYIALEDGFIRSVFPGADNAPLSLVIDRRGVHYDATRASELEALIVASTRDATRERLLRARAGIARLRSAAISKYNYAPLLDERELGLDTDRRAGRILVVDQTCGDASVSCGLANAESFEAMLAAARSENPGCEIVVKSHPEVALGHKEGFLGRIAPSDDVKVVSGHVNPWSLLEAVDKIYVVTSQLGLEGLIAGKHVVCFGAPFYSNWGLTDDRAAVPRRAAARPTLEQLFAAVYFDYSRYFCPGTHRQITFEAAVDLLLQQRREAVGY